MPPDTRPSARGPLPLLLGAATGLLVGALGFAILLHAHPASAPTAGPATIARALCADLSAQRYADIYNSLAASEQAQGTQAQFVASQQQLDALLGRVTRCTIGASQTTAASAAITLSVARGSGGGAPGEIRLGVQGGAWRVVSYDTSII